MLQRLRASNPLIRTAPQTVYVHAPFEAVWAATVEFFADSRLPISTIDKGSGLLVSKDFQLSSDLFERWGVCEKGKTIAPQMKRGLARASTDFNVFVRAACDSTSVRVNAGLRAEAVNPLLGRPFQFVPVRCTGNGTFDRDLIAYIVAHPKAP